MSGSIWGVHDGYADGSQVRTYCTLLVKTNVPVMNNNQSISPLLNSWFPLDNSMAKPIGTDATTEGDETADESHVTALQGCKEEFERRACVG